MLVLSLCVAQGANEGRFEMRCAVCAKQVIADGRTGGTLEERLRRHGCCVLCILALAVCNSGTRCKDYISRLILLGEELFKHGT